MSIRLKDTIFDTANYSADSDKIDGLDSTSLFRKLGTNVDINTFADGSNKNGIIYINTTTPADINAPFSYGTILSFNSAAGSWMLGNSSAGTLKFRNRWWSESGATWSDWKDIAFKTDIPTALKNPQSLTIQNNGTTIDSYDGSSAKTINITHPTSLKCPTSLTIQFNGTSQGAWDGSTAKTINITPAAIGAAAAHNHPYLSTNGGTLTGNLVLEGNGDYRCIRVGKETGNNAVFHNSSYTGSSREASISWMNGTTTIGSIGVSTYPFFVNSSSNVYKIWHEGNDGSGSGLDADLLDDWHKNYFSIGYNGSRHYHLKFGGGAEDLAWKTIVKGSTSVTTAPSSNQYIAMTVRGTIWYCNGNHGQMETKMYPFCAVFQCVSAKTIINAAYLWLPPFAKSIDCIRIVRISTNSFELQVRQVSSWENGWIDYQILNSGMTVNAYDTLQTAGSGTVVKTAADSSTISEGAMPSHTHEYASTVKVGTTSYTSSGNVVSLPAYPTIPTSLKCPASLTIQLNGTTQGAWDGSSAKTINITPASIGASASHTHPYLPLAGGTLTGNVTVHTGANGTGLKFGTSTLNSLSNQLLWQSAEAIRFGSSDWDWNKWAGLKYNSSSKIIYLGIPDNVIFNANAAQSGGSIYTPGVSSIYVGNGTYAVLHSNNWSSYCAPASHNHTTIVGNYTANGGKQNPDYFGTNRVGALMMNTSVNGNSQYKDWLFMDCYSGSDVGGGVAIGVNRQSLGAYIMRSAAARTSWAESAELLGTHNYTTYCAPASHTHPYLSTNIAERLTSTATVNYTNTPYGVNYRNHYSGHGLGSYRGVLTCKDNSVGFELNSYWCVNPADGVGTNNLYYRVKRDSVSDWGPYARIIDSGNIGSQSVNYANSAGNANTVDGYHIVVGSTGTDASTIYIVT